MTQLIETPYKVFTDLSVNRGVPQALGFSVTKASEILFIYEEKDSDDIYHNVPVTGVLPVTSVILGVVGTVKTKGTYGSPQVVFSDIAGTETNAYLANFRVTVYRVTDFTQDLIFSPNTDIAESTRIALDKITRVVTENKDATKRSFRLSPLQGEDLPDLPPLAKGFHQVPVVTLHKAAAVDPSKSNKLEFGWSSLNDSDTAPAQFQELVDEAEAAQKAAEVALARVQDLATSFEHGPTTGLPNKQHPSYTENTLSFELERDSTVAGAVGEIKTATYVIKDHTKWPRLTEDVGFIAALRHPQLTISSDFDDDSVLQFELNSPYLNANIKQIRLEVTNSGGPNNKVARLVAGGGASFVRVVPSNANYEGEWLAFRFKVDKDALRVAGTLLPADLMTNFPAADNGDISGLGLKLRFEMRLYSEDDVNYPDSSGLNFVRAVTDRTLAAGLSWLVPFGNVANLSRRVVDVGLPWLVPFGPVGLPWLLPFASVANLSKGIDETAGDPNAIISGQTRPNSEEPDFFEYENAGANGKLLVKGSAATPLQLRVGGERQKDIVATETIQLTNAERAPSVNNANSKFESITTGPALVGEEDFVVGVNPVNFSHGQINMGSAGSLITDKIGKYATFFNNSEGHNKYVFGFIQSATRITNAIHGFISESTSNLAGGDNYDPYTSTITATHDWFLRSTLWVIYERTNPGTGTLGVVKDGPTYGAVLPAVSTAGAWWVRTTDNSWHERDVTNTAWVAKSVVHLGWIIVDESGLIIGARCAPFARRYSNENNCQIERISANAFRTTQSRWRTSVNGRMLEYKHEVTWDKTIVAHVESGLDLTEAKWVGLYIKDDAEPIIGVIGFLDRSTKSYRHRKDSWRQVGKAWIDDSGDFTIGENLFPHQKYLSATGTIPKKYYANIRAAGPIDAQGPVRWLQASSHSASGRYRLTPEPGIFQIPTGFKLIWSASAPDSSITASVSYSHQDDVFLMITRISNNGIFTNREANVVIFLSGKQERQTDLDNTLRP